MPAEKGPHFFSPKEVAPPLGAYSHVAIVPGGSELIVVAGQLGNEINGFVPADPELQYELALRNLVAVLNGCGTAPDHIVKLTTYLVAQLHLEAIREIRLAVLGNVAPPATLVYVPALAAPKYLVEIDALALRPMSAP
jgi:2-iminobutanoate/2-iminopropanoate deaminase